MIALIVGIILIAFCIYACLPGIGLGWGADVLVFLRGCTPVVAVIVGLITFFIGVADIKDKREAKKEEEAAKELEEQTRKKMENR